jgi:hypothetical protein
MIDRTLEYHLRNMNNVRSVLSTYDYMKCTVKRKEVDGCPSACGSLLQGPAGHADAHADVSQKLPFHNNKNNKDLFVKYFII